MSRPQSGSDVDLLCAVSVRGDMLLFPLSGMSSTGFGGGGCGGNGGGGNGGGRNPWNPPPPWSWIGAPPPPRRKRRRKRWQEYGEDDDAEEVQEDEEAGGGEELDWHTFPRNSRERRLNRRHDNLMDRIAHLEELVVRLGGGERVMESGFHPPVLPPALPRPPGLPNLHPRHCKLAPQAHPFKLMGFSSCGGVLALVPNLRRTPADARGDRGC